VNKQSHPDSSPPESGQPFAAPEAAAVRGRRRADSATKPGKTKSIKRRVVQLVLIPSAALILVWFGASVYLFGTGFYDRAVASSVQSISIPAVRGLASLQRERQLSMAHLAQPNVGLQTLLVQQQQTDTELAQMKDAAAAMLPSAPDSIVSSYNKLIGDLGQLPKIRGLVDAGAATPTDVYTYYNNVLDAATGLFDSQARVIPDVTATQGGIAAVEVFRISDAVSRAGSLVSGAFAANTFSDQDFLQFATMVGGYRTALTNIAPSLEPDVQAQYRQLIDNQSWQNLIDAENAVISHGPWTNGIPATLGVSEADWNTLTDQNFSALTQMTITQADQVSNRAIDGGNQQLIWVALGSVIALGIAITAILVALRQSRVLVDRALVVRLARLRDEARSLVAVRLPDIVRRLRDGETVDVAEELPELHYGEDEIGQVATAINAAQRTAVAAAVQEAQARNGVHAVFLGIAHRNQRPLHRMLNLLDRWEQREQDPAQLERLFQLDHQATQARRNIENLIILGGGQLGRRWRTPVSVLELLRAAIAETKQYARIKLQRVPEVTVTGDAVAGVIHLVSELLDNAISFSSPEYPVLVSSKRVDMGVVVEVEDQGLGISVAERNRANLMMLEPPEFDVMALKDGSQLGFWVIAQLGSRMGVRVELRQSAYGGVLAIVLIPNRLLTETADEQAFEQEAFEAPAVEFESTIEFPTLDPDLVYSAPQHNEPEPTGAHALGRNGSDNGYRSAQQTLLAGWADGSSVGTESNDMPQHAPLPSRETQVPAELPVGEPLRPIAGPGERPPLPQRQPQQHLVKQLLDGDAVDAVPRSAEGATDLPTTQSAEDIRARLSAFQRGSSDGRRADEGTS
jgi:nitrate/nitrite sensing protein/histidine kinase/DNA gyrase B/HSP90-like ATPase